MLIDKMSRSSLVPFFETKRFQATSLEEERCLQNADIHFLHESALGFWGMGGAWSTLVVLSSPMTPVHQDNYPPYLEHTSFPELLSRASCSNSRARYTKARASDGLDLTLPSAWNPNDKSPHLAIGGNGLDLTYTGTSQKYHCILSFFKHELKRECITGPGRSEIHAAAARSNHPIRHQCGIYYFEMLVKAKGEDGFIGIGFCGRNNKLDRLPGKHLAQVGGRR